MLSAKAPFSGGGWSIFIAAALLCLISIALIFSATHNSPDTRLHDYYLKQAVWFFAGIMVFFMTVMIPLRVHEILAYVYYTVIVLLLVGLIMFGVAKFGGQRWYAFGFFNFQPSEIAKVALIFTLARYLTYSKRSIHSLRKVLTAAFLCAFLTLLVLRQPDLGTSIIFLVVFVAMMFWAGLPAPYLLLILSPAMSMIASSNTVSWIIFFVLLFVAIVLMRPGIRFSAITVAVNLLFGALSSIAWNNLHDYQKMRIKIFLDPGQDPLGAGYQIIQSKVAIGSGGLLGKGYLAGSQSQLDYLPLRHTDFVYSVAGEEFGLVGALVILVLFGFIFYRGIAAAAKTRNNFASLVAIGATTVLAFQMSVNIGMVLGLMPVTGLPLPFLSYGGSSMVVSWILLGLLVNIDRNWQDY